MIQPRIHVCTFTLRYDECNAFGYSRPASILRIMQEAAFGASAAAGYDLKRYNAMHRLWLIRETSITFHPRPPAYGDTISVTTYVQDFRRVRSRRAYSLTNATTGEPVAEASTDWVLFDVDRERPATVPEEMIAAFFPNGQPDPASLPPREPFPDLPPAPPEAFTSQRRPDWRDLDGAHHVNNTIYLDYLEDSLLGALHTHGWPLARLAQVETGVWPHHARIEYVQSVQPGDACTVALWGAGASGDDPLYHTISRADATPSGRADTLMVRARIAWGWVHTHTFQPVDAPDGLDQFTSLFAPPSL